MDGRTRTWLGHHRGVLSTADAHLLGLGHAELRRLVGSGQLVRVARGAYADAASFRTATTEQRHLLRARALLRSRRDLAASHTTAALVWGLPVPRAALDRVHLMRTSAGSSRRTGAGTVHQLLHPDALTRQQDLPVVHVSLAVIGTAMVAGFEAGVITCDAALHAGLTSAEAITGWLGRMPHVPGTAAAREALHRSDARSESPGESRLRLTLEALGYTVVSQHEVRDLRGDFVARVDFLLPELGVVVEFDGAVKYAGERGPAALMAEKRREDDIRLQGYAVARVTWVDLDHPSRIQERIGQAARVARRGA